MPQERATGLVFSIHRSMSRIPFVAVFVLFSFCPPLLGQQQLQNILVNVMDANGAAVSGANVRVFFGSQSVICAAYDGAYACRVPADTAISFEIKAEGFRNFRAHFGSDELNGSKCVFVMQVGGIDAKVVTIARTETQIGESPESITVLSEERLAATAAPTLDDALRQVPGFSIFRRSNSRNANPTAQGVSLRGVGASGASRSIVLFDGVPLNDPFGGWVQWNRVPPIAVESVEVFRGGASSLYGNSSLSGAIGIVPRSEENRFDFSAEFFGGSQRTLSASGFAGTRYKGWLLDGSAGHFQTRGFVPVDVLERGLVDSYAGVRTVNSSVRIGREIGKVANVFVRHNYFGESRTNGTPGQSNRTHSRQFVVGGRSLTEKEDIPVFEVRIYGGTQVYDQPFTAVASDRASESLTRLQRSPSQHLGFSGTINSTYRRHVIAAGFEGREVRGASDEIGYFGGRPTSMLGVSGRERSFGAFVRDVFRIGEKAVIGGGVRYDRWRNFRAHSTTTSLTTRDSVANAFADREESAWSPSASILIQPNEQLSFHVAASRSFRAPTLNELYRGFRVGNVVTNANENLLAERATNFEAGGAWRQSHTGIRLTGFIAEIDRTISNVTVSVTPSLITRQRLNAGKTRTRGVEIDAETRVAALELTAGYLFVDSRVNEFPSNPVLVDKLIPQVPRHQFTFQTRLPYRTWIFAAQGRTSGEQFDDDLNAFRLEPYFQVDAFVSKRSKEKFEIFAAVENLLNSRYSVGRTPVRTISSPISARLGIRWN